MTLAIIIIIIRLLNCRFYAVNFTNSRRLQRASDSD